MAGKEEEQRKDKDAETVLAEFLVNTPEDKLSQMTRIGAHQVLPMAMVEMIAQATRDIEWDLAHPGEVEEGRKLWSQVLIESIYKLNRSRNADFVKDVVMLTQDQMASKMEEPPKFQEPPRDF